MKLLHISDLHLVKDGDRKAYQQHIKGRFIEFIQQVTDIRKSALGIAIDHIIITGDLQDAKSSSIVDPDLMVDLVYDFIYDIVSAAGVDSARNVHIVPGNHEVKREKDRDTWEQKNDQFNAFFHKFCDRFYGYEHNPWRGEDGRKPCTFVLCEGAGGDGKSGKAGFVYVNSALDCTDSKSDWRNKLGLHPDVFSILHKHGSEVDQFIILAHHPLSWISDESRKSLESVLAKRMDNTKRVYWLSGHNHDTKAQEIISRPNFTPVTIGSLMGFHGEFYELPDFAVHGVLDEGSLRVYRFLPHLNLSSDLSVAPGGWKLIPSTGAELYPSQNILLTPKI